MLSYCIYVPGIYVNVIYYTQTGGNICFVQGHLFLINLNVKINVWYFNNVDKQCLYCTLEISMRFV